MRVEIEKCLNELWLQNIWDNFDASIFRNVVVFFYIIQEYFENAWLSRKNEFLNLPMVNSKVSNKYLYRTRKINVYTPSSDTAWGRLGMSCIVDRWVSSPDHIGYKRSFQNCQIGGAQCSDDQLVGHCLHPLLTRPLHLCHRPRPRPLPRSH